MTWPFRNKYRGQYLHLLGLRFKKFENPRSATRQVVLAECTQRQNDLSNILLCLHLPRYVSIDLLHQSACLPRIKERLIQLASSLVAKMRQSNPLVRDMVVKHESKILNLIIQGQNNTNRSHRSPLDIILPAQRPFLSST